jgi:hypothetical protein
MPETRLPTLSAPPPPDATPTLVTLPTRVANEFPPADVPACMGVQSLDRLPFRFAWDVADKSYANPYDNAPLENWTYYRCAASLADLVIFYRRVLTLPNWEQHASDPRPEGTLIIYDNALNVTTVDHRWLYLWMLPDPSASRSSLLVAAWWNGPKTC